MPYCNRSRSYGYERMQRQTQTVHLSHTHCRPGPTPPPAPRQRRWGPDHRQIAPSVRLALRLPGLGLCSRLHRVPLSLTCGPRAAHETHAALLLLPVHSTPLLFPTVAPREPRRRAPLPQPPHPIPMACLAAGAEAAPLLFRRRLAPSPVAARRRLLVSCRARRRGLRLVAQSAGSRGCGVVGAPGCDYWCVAWSRSFVLSSLLLRRTGGMAFWGLGWVGLGDRGSRNSIPLVVRACMHGMLRS